MSTTTARSEKVLRENGFLSGLVERHIPHAFVTKDFLGFADVIAFYPGKSQVWAINSTTNKHLSDHITKYGEAEVKHNIDAWIASGHIFEIHCWAKTGARGKRKLWTLKRVRRLLDGAWMEIPAGENF